MPKYINTASYPIYYGNKVFIPNQMVETYDVINTYAYVVTVKGPFDIISDTNDKLVLRFNNEEAWVTITLTSGDDQTAEQIAEDINDGYGSVVATAEYDRVTITAPRVHNEFSAVWIADTDSTANGVLGLNGNDVNPVSLVCKQVFLNSSKSEPFDIINDKKTFIFKFNNMENWIIANLTTGSSVSADDVCHDLNAAYFMATGRHDKIAIPVELSSGNYHIQLIAPVINNYISKIYIREMGNTAASVLGFSTDDSNPLVVNQYPQLYLVDLSPLYNPIISSTKLIFSSASIQVYYVNSPINCRKFHFTAISTNFNIFIQSESNEPEIIVSAGTTFTLENTILGLTKLYIQSEGSGSIIIQEMK